jgi:hypothetical protein
LFSVITHVSSAPQLHMNTQTIPLSSPTKEQQQHIIELLQREPLPTLSPSNNTKSVLNNQTQT